MPVEVIAPVTTVQVLEDSKVTVVSEPITSIVEVGIQGPQGPSGTAGGGGAFAFTFTPTGALSVWNVAHALGGYPNVTVVDSSTNEVEADVHYVDANNLTISFSQAFYGIAYLS